LKREYGRTFLEDFGVEEVDDPLTLPELPSILRDKGIDDKDRIVRRLTELFGPPRPVNKRSKKSQQRLPDTDSPADGATNDQEDVAQHTTTSGK